MSTDPHDRPLLEQDVLTNPVEQFSKWFDEAGGSVRLPEAVALATVGAQGAPSVRMVLLKSFDSRGFVFFTDGSSRKGLELELNPVAAMVFYWDPLGRQVRIEGAIEQLSPQESDEYFDTRPRGSQIAAHTSHQSQPIDSRGDLEERVREMTERFDGKDVPRPPRWGGYRLVHTSVELWQNRTDRLHDRLLYTWTNDGWTLERLQP